MFYLKKYQSKKLSLKDISKKMNMQDWQINKLYAQSIKYQEEELLENIKKLANLDLGIKIGSLDKDVALMSFLIKACG